mmetsp:Transcript_22466/g.67279  ORF Transcript_22466/g.67279 Transcript_22466/m.67279 type:complete len:666 (-) Transcript_22466:21-2018(-)
MGAGAFFRRSEDHRAQAADAFKAKGAAGAGAESSEAILPGGPPASTVAAPPEASSGAAARLSAHQARSLAHVLRKEGIGLDDSVGEQQLREALEAVGAPLPEALRGRLGSPCAVGGASAAEGEVLREVLAQVEDVLPEHRPLGSAAPSPDASLGHPLRGVSVYHLGSDMLRDVDAVGLGPQSRVYEVEPVVIRPRGEKVRCPRDGLPGAAYVDAVTGVDHAGPATFMLSYTWGYTIGDIVDSLSAFCERERLNQKSTYVWMCALCINQHQVMAASSAKESDDLVRTESVPFDHFRQEFGDRVNGIKHVVALMAPWDAPLYVTRVWCVFEMYTADEMDVKVTIIMPPREEDALRANLRKDRQGASDVIRKLGAIDVQHAQASVPRDRECILDLVAKGPGFDQFNHTVGRHLQNWVVDTSENYLQSMFDSGTATVDPEFMLLCENVNKLLRQMRHTKRATDIVEKALSLMEQSDCPLTVDRANMYRQIGIARREKAQFDAADKAFAEASRIHEATNTMESAEGALVLLNWGINKVELDELDGASNTFACAWDIARRLDLAGTNVGGLLHRWSGILSFKQGHFAKAASEAGEAMDIFRRTGYGVGVELLFEAGQAREQTGDFEGALEALEEARAICESKKCSNEDRRRRIETAIERVRPAVSLEMPAP